jgi:hypothetical protein
MLLVETIFIFQSIIGTIQSNNSEIRTTSSETDLFNTHFESACMSEHWNQAKAAAFLAIHGIQELLQAPAR